MNDFNSLQDFLDSLSPSPDNTVSLVDYKAAKRACEFRQTLLDFMGHNTEYALDKFNKRILDIVDAVFQKGNHSDMKVATTDFINRVIETMTDPAIDNDLTEGCNGLKSEVIGIIGEALFIARENFTDLIGKAISNEDDRLDINTLYDRQFVAMSVLRYISEESKHTA